MDIPVWRKVIYSIAAPFIILTFIVCHPRKVWEQVKKEWGA